LLLFTFLLFCFLGLPRQGVLATAQRNLCANDFPLIFALKPIAAFSVESDGFDDFQEGTGGV